jgi:hypothetical protein
MVSPLLLLKEEDMACRIDGLVGVLAASMHGEELNAKLCRIPGVLGANVVFDERGDLDEVHIMADCSRAAKEIMLDAKSVLFVCLKTPIDFRKISVARIDTTAEPAGEVPQLSGQARGEVPRVMLTAAYVKRLSSERYQVVVELKLGEELLSGSGDGVSRREPIQRVAAAATLGALSRLLPAAHITAQIELLGSYCIADLVVTDEQSPYGHNLVGAVKSTGDIPSDVSRAILKALNRRLGPAILEYLAAAASE